MRLALGHPDPQVPPRHAGILDHPVAQRRMPPDHDPQIGLRQLGVAEHQADRPAGAVAAAQHPARLQASHRSPGELTAPPPYAPLSTDRSTLSIICP